MIHIILVFILLSCEGVSPYNETPDTPESEEDKPVEGSWIEILQNDDCYPDNVYLTELIEFNPGEVGSARTGYSNLCDTDGYPYENNNALGPPEGSYPSTFSNPDASITILGSEGWAVWLFNPEYVIINGKGDDFITFSNHNVFSGNPDGSWNELARVYVSEDNINWFEHSSLNYKNHPDPGKAATGYDWSEIEGLHGNTHTWVNFRIDTESEKLDSDGIYTDIIDNYGNPVKISKYFTAATEHLGGDSFDLSYFVNCDNGEAWPADGEMRYLKIVDDPAILDGQDWNPDWMTGARIMAAMGINTEYKGSAP